MLLYIVNAFATGKCALEIEVVSILDLIINDLIRLLLSLGLLVVGRLQFHTVHRHPSLHASYQIDAYLPSGLYTVKYRQSTGRHLDLSSNGGSP